jgi:hypothetical protein
MPQPQTIQAAVPPALSLTLSSSQFVRCWKNCGLISDYVARYLSDKEQDAERHGIYLSGVLNEAIELVHRTSAQEGPIVIVATKNGKEFSFDIDFQAADAALDVLSGCAAQLGSPSGDAGNASALGIVRVTQTHSCRAAITPLDSGTRHRVFLAVDTADMDAELAPCQ